MRNLLFYLFNFIGVLCFAQDDGRIVYIPVVFHVIYSDSSADNGAGPTSVDKGNNTMFITEEKIKNELRDLDNAFQAKNSDLSNVIAEYEPSVGQANVHFSLQEIKYVRAGAMHIRLPFTNTDRLHNISPMVDPKRTLNVYISVIKFKGSHTNGVSPVKTSLSAGDENDAVNINYQWVGLGYRLLTHEVGHWLGLWHTWDESQLSDGIDDIPLQSGPTHVDCVLCPPKVQDQIVSESKFKNSNYQNFMDYSGCRIMFSKKQVLQIRKVIEKYRPEIWKGL
jgi:hypothetical protein